MESISCQRPWPAATWECPFHSFSSANWPILACSVLMSGPPSRFSAAVANTSAARCNNSVFHCVIWFGWTSNRSASCTSVYSPFTAANATLALNAAEWLRRGRLMLSAPFISGAIIAAKCRAVTYTPVQIPGATSDIGLETRTEGTRQRIVPSLA
jgi:hypothetical protein